MAYGEAFRQAQLAVAFPALWQRQTYFGVPLDDSLLTGRLNIVTPRHISPETRLRDLISCDGRYLRGRTVLTQIGRLTIESDADSINLPGLLAFALGAAAAPAPVAASDAEQLVTITGTPTAGVYHLAILDPISGNVVTTPAITYNSLAADFQTALNSVLGASATTVTGSAGGPYTVSFAGGPLDGYDVRTMELEVNALTGGTFPSVVVSVNTVGGPARQSHAITEYTANFQKPVTTFIVGFDDPEAEDPVLFQDAALNTITVTGRVGEPTRVTAEFVGRGNMPSVPGFSFAACADQIEVEFNEGSLVMQGTEYIGITRGVEFTQDNGILVDTDPFSGFSIYPRRLETADRVTQSFNLTLEGHIGDDIFDLAAANNQLGTEVALDWRIGKGSQGVHIASPEALLRLSGDPQGFDGEANRSVLALLAEPLRSTNDPLKPVNVVAVNQKSTSYLTAA